MIRVKQVQRSITRTPDHQAQMLVGSCVANFEQSVQACLSLYLYSILLCQLLRHGIEVQSQTSLQFAVQEPNNLRHGKHLACCNWSMTVLTFCIEGDCVQQHMTGMCECQGCGTFDPTSFQPCVLLNSCKSTGRAVHD